jgi:predicted metal-binding membrane protein
MALGVAAFPLGVVLTAVEVRLSPPAPVYPIAAGAVVLLAGAFQFTTWKAHHLARCREAPGHGRTLPANADTAWRHGLRLGLHCISSCSGLTAILLVFGMMDLRSMAVITAAITAERLLPAGAHAAKSIGAVALFAGFLLLAQAAGV